MRRKYFGLAIAAIATIGPLQAWGGDREIAEQIIQRLKVNRESGALKDFTLDMKVDQGVVLFRGNVSEDVQKDLVLEAADGIEGIAKIVDEVSVKPVATPAPAKVEPAKATAKVVKPKAALAVAEPVSVKPAKDLTPAPAAKREGDFSFRQALAAQAKAIDIPTRPALQVMPGEIQRTAAVEPSNDAQVVSAVVSALKKAKATGQLQGFGVDVKSSNGVLQLKGRASSAQQRDAIVRIAENVRGVSGVREAIAIPSAAPRLPRLPEPPSLAEVNPALAPVAVDAVNRPARQQHSQQVPARTVSGPVGMPAMAAPYRMQAQTPAMQASHPIAGQPVPMAPYSAVGTPRYDTPNLPNYAWPGYSAHPNYAALTYPQQYSPSAWPYIGPFYPYPQVPLGWRKVSLEWDDGWWMLDFTDR
jgi:osmotically-inducible protein OsmY